MFQLAARLVENFAQFQWDQLQRGSNPFELRRQEALRADGFASGCVGSP